MDTTRPAPAAEQRAAARRQPTVGTVYHLGDWGLGLVWNISEGGVSLLVHDAPERGATVRGELATADDGYALPVGLRVAHVAKLRTGDYVVGGRSSGRWPPRSCATSWPGAARGRTPGAVGSA
jgi:hypothetical protein